MKLIIQTTEINAYKYLCFICSEGILHSECRKSGTFFEWEVKVIIHEVKNHIARLSFIHCAIFFYLLHVFIFHTLLSCIFKQVQVQILAVDLRWHKECESWLNLWCHSAKLGLEHSMKNKMYLGDVMVCDICWQWQGTCICERKIKRFHLHVLWITNVFMCLRVLYRIFKFYGGHYKPYCRQFLGTLSSHVLSLFFKWCFPKDRNFVDVISIAFYS